MTGIHSFILLQKVLKTRQGTISSTWGVSKKRRECPSVHNPDADLDNIVAEPMRQWYTIAKQQPQPLRDKKRLLAVSSKESGF